MARSTELVVGLLLAIAAVASPVAVAGRLVDLVDVSEKDRNVNVLVQFNCSARYVAHTPPATGKSLDARFRLGSDCGAADGGFGAEVPPLGGGSGFVTGARLEASAPGEVTLSLQWKLPANFVVVPTTDGRGFRVRLLDVLPGVQGEVTVVEPGTPIEGFSINIDSSRQDFPQDVVDRASRELKLPAYVSPIELDGVTWYRLRVGPVGTRAEAQRALELARSGRYPRAWLAIDDETGQVPSAGGTVPVDARPARVKDPPLPEDARRALLKDAQSAMRARQFPRAIELLTKLVRQPEYRDRALAQEMLGLARERAGQLAHAKAEYEEYLRTYPDGPAASRLRSRIRSLRAAAGPVRRGAGGGFDDEGGWRISGSASQMVRRDDGTVAGDTGMQMQTLQQAMFTDGDLVARRKGERWNFVSRVSAGYAYDLQKDGPGNQTRVSAAFVELGDLDHGVSGRFGRQPRTPGTLGTFDGLLVAWERRPGWTLTGFAGSPVDSSRNGFDSARRFAGVALDLGPVRRKVDVSFFAVTQQLDGLTDRRAVGVEARWFVPGRSLVGLVDFDVGYSALNSAILLGNFEIGGKWFLSFDLDHRLAPVLTTRNALIGQPFRSLQDMQSAFSQTEIEQLARDRTPITDLASVSLSRPLGSKWQVALDASGMRTSDTPASGDVAATPSIGTELAFQAQLSGAGLWRSNDLYVLTLRRQQSSLQSLDSAGLAVRMPLWGAWRIGPRLRVDRLQQKSTASVRTALFPTLRIDYQRGRSLLELEGGQEFSRTTPEPVGGDLRRRYFMLGYRIGF